MYSSSSCFSKIAKCDECKIKVAEENKNKAKDKIFKKICKNCNSSFESKKSRAKVCSEKCAHELSVKNGLKSKESRFKSRRSANEIHFAELCKQRFENILENQKIFPLPTNPSKLWDCDVALIDLKIAVLWNGAWHYQEIKGSSLKQIQTRDRIRLKCIEIAGFVPYIIKDMGRKNPKFVEEQFEIFLIWLETRNK